MNSSQEKRGAISFAGVTMALSVLLIPAIAQNSSQATGQRPTQVTYQLRALGIEISKPSLIVALGNSDPKIRVLAAAQLGQDQPHIEVLFAQLGNDQTAGKASAELRMLAQEDAGSHQQIAKRLPNLLGGTDRGPLWYASAQLAGDLKIVETVPTLTECLRRDHRSGPFTLSMEARLYDDPVARALSEIGEPATNSVSKLFQDGDAPTRRRAVIVLSNIGTDNAREAIRRQVDKEPDGGLKAFMQRKLDRKE